jgi:3-deoxy-D-manno-octulosonic-acid transferase
MTLLAAAWHVGASLLAPLIPAFLRLRAARGREIATRRPERYGAVPPGARPEGPLVWVHAASVGEMLSVLPVLDAMGRRAPTLCVLLTTGTVTAARLLDERLPPALRGRLIHRFVPLDVPAWAERFLAGWRPDAAAFVESELWPNLIAATRRRGVALALVNARLSPRSARRWRHAAGLARHLLSAFSLVLAQSEGDAARLRGLGAEGARVLGNLKDAAAPLPAAADALAALRAAIGPRPVLLAASTHPGEDAIVLAAHRLMTATLPGLLTVIVPRHPARGAAIAAIAAGSGLAVARRAAAALPGPATAIYVADTLGELGLFYRVAGVALVGGSLVRHGGQNPDEPARLGCPVLLGPHTWNFEASVARLLEAGAARRVAPTPTDPAPLAAAALAVLTSPVEQKAMAAAAMRAAAPTSGLAERVAEALLGLLPAGAEALHHAGPGPRQDAPAGQARADRVPATAAPVPAAPTRPSA